jgi:hypothetical protein
MAKSESGIHPIVAIVAALVIAVGIIGGYLWATYTPPVHNGQLVSITTYPIHRELSTGSALGGLEGQKDIYDEEIVIANVRIQSNTKLPLFLHDMWADVTLADGTVERSPAASSNDYRAVFVAYPTLASSRTTPVPRDITMTPGQVIDGQLVFHYPISAQQWDHRREFKVYIQFIHQKDLVLEEKPTAAGQKT